MNQPDFSVNLNYQGLVFTFSVPRWANWLTVDENGSVWAFDLEPSVTANCGWANGGHAALKAKNVGRINPTPVRDWTQRKYGLSNAAAAVARTAAPVISSKEAIVNATF